MLLCTFLSILKFVLKSSFIFYTISSSVKELLRIKSFGCAFAFKESAISAIFAKKKFFSNGNINLCLQYTFLNNTSFIKTISLKMYSAGAFLKPVLTVSFKYWNVICTHATQI